MKYLLILIILSFNVNAEFVAKFGGWSKHSDKAYGNGIKYNESHRGYGFDYINGDGNFKFISGVWYMKDSYNKDSFQIGAGVSYTVNEYIDFNLVVAHFDRSVVEVARGDYDENGWEKFRIVRTQFVLPLPYVTINLSDKINMDIMALVNPFEGSSVIFARLGYKF